MNALEYFESLTQKPMQDSTIVSLSETRKSTPARRQIQAVPQTSKAVEEGYAYNIWYHRWSGGGFDSFKKQIDEVAKAQYRCIIDKDEGTTKADETPGKVPFCLYFARGCCARGSSCQFKHRLPLPVDSHVLDASRDVFGRTKFSSDRDDYQGVGSFNRECKTLQVSNFGMNPSIDLDIRDHFSEWGEIFDMRVDPERCVSYIEFNHRGNAEFAKEAMHGQSLNHEEVLVVKWSQRDDMFRDKKRRAVTQKEPEVKKVCVESVEVEADFTDQDKFSNFLSTLE
ncbi:hypothetical protein GEMRC1_001510 [Eukaryota sp. GEM-RC1]